MILSAGVIISLIVYAIIFAETCSKKKPIENTKKVFKKDKEISNYKYPVRLHNENRLR